MADRRPLLSGMDDDYGSYALSQKASFERTFPAVMEAALGFADEPVLRVVDQGASDGRNSHALMRDLIAMRAGRPLAYSFIDMPTNPWDVAHGRLNADPVIGPAAHVVPTPADTRAVDAGSGGHLASADDHAAAVDEALTSGATTVIGMAGIPLHTGLSAPAGTVHMAITGTTMHWVEAPQDLGSARSVFPGYPDHHNEIERSAWRDAAARQWDQLVRLRAAELVPGGWFIAALPASEMPCPDRTGLYAEIARDMNAVLAEWVASGHIAQATADAVVVPVWMRTVEEIRAPFDAGGGDVDGLVIERVELFHLDNPYFDPDPAVFARDFVRSCLAWGGPLFRRAFTREGEDRADQLLGEFLAEIEARVAADPGRHRWDYLEALVVCRKRD